MINLPGWMITILTDFASVIYGVSTGRKVEVLVVGAILATVKRTVSAVLHVMGLSQSGTYAQYHQVLNRAVWSGREASGVLLRMLLKTFASAGEPLVFGIDETLERRWGAKIAVRSSKSHLVKPSGLRWISLMWLTEIPWTHMVSTDRLTVYDIHAKRGMAARFAEHRLFTAICTFRHNYLLVQVLRTRLTTLLQRRTSDNIRFIL